MDKYALLSLRGNFIKVHSAKTEISIANLIRAQKEAAWMVETRQYDMNEDGIVNAIDLVMIFTLM